MMPSVSTEGKPFEGIRMLDNLVDELERMLNDLKPHEEDNKYVIFAVRDLSWISLSLISSLARNIHWRYNSYTAACMTRLLMECVTEIKYVKSRHKKARTFWESQKKISDALRNAKTEDRKWQLFMDGSLNRYGQLSDSTMKRVQSMLGEQDFGRYQLFCFYSHPNIAGYSWVSRDQSQPGVVIRFAAETFFKMIDELLIALGSVESQRLKVDDMRERLHQAYLKYKLECEEQE